MFLQEYDMILAGKWMKLDVIVLSEINQAQWNLDLK
jgi:hypothetical protein